MRIEGDGVAPSSMRSFRLPAEGTEVRTKPVPALRSFRTERKMRKGGLEPPRVISPQDPESCASASSATFARGERRYLRVRWRRVKVTDGGSGAGRAPPGSRR